MARGDAYYRLHVRSRRQTRRAAVRAVAWLAAGVAVVVGAWAYLSFVLAVAE